MIQGSNDRMYEVLNEFVKLSSTDTRLTRAIFKAMEKYSNECQNELIRQLTLKTKPKWITNHGLKSLQQKQS